MNAILVTGASGFLGSSLVARLERDEAPVVSLSRRPVIAKGMVVTGPFTDERTLGRIGDVPIDTVVHLAAEIGGCTEEDGLAVNVCGTRRLIRHLADRGVRRFILASSIAAPIGLDPSALPLELPIPDDHPCRAADAYGLSKALMEEVVYYFHRQDPGLDLTLFRMGVVLKPDAPPASLETLQKVRMPFIQLSTISIEDVVDVLHQVASAPPAPGIRRVNLVAPWTRTDRPVPDTLQLVLGDRANELDLSHYAVPGHEFDSLFSVERLEKLYGFEPKTDPRTMLPTNEDKERSRP